MCMVARRESSGDCLTRQYLDRMRLAAILLFVATLAAQPAPTAVDAGSSPQIAVDTRGVVRIVYGRKDTAFVVTSPDNGAIFGAPAIVGASLRPTGGGARSQPEPLRELPCHKAR